MSLLCEQRQKESSFDDLGQTRNVGQNEVQQQQTSSMNLRKYLVLLHDCMAIKFVPLVPTNSNPFSFPLNAGNRNYGGSSNTGNNQPLNYNMDHQRLSRSASSCSKTKSNAGLSSAAPSTVFNEKSTSEVDHSLHGHYLYKSFREANLKCYWNSALYEAFRNLEYRGCIVPSIVLVWAIPRFFATLRTAWSRQMIRSPPGFRIEFIGEIEELIADPIQQSQFAPLSDSLCWAILEITSMGQEAFVDSILQGLLTAFPKMVQPNREVVYSTLEKLTRERKVYQTSQGYFVVTPDTFRYMIASNSQPHSDVASFNRGGGALTLDALITPPHQDQDPEKRSLSHHSWDSTASAENPIQFPRESRSFEEHDSEKTEPRLRRHNSLKIIRQKDNVGTGKGLLSRSLSFRLYKSKSVHNTMEDSSDGSKGRDFRNDKLSKQMQNLMKPDQAARRNSLPRTALGKFRNLFRKSNSSTSSKQSGSKNKKESSVIKSSTSTQTQTPTFSDKPKSPKPPPDRIIIARPTTIETEKDLASLGHFTLPFECDGHLNRNPYWNSLPQRHAMERPVSRQSVGDDRSSCHLYSTPISPDHFPGTNGRPHTLLPGFPFNRGESSRCSTLSQGTSLGYGSQGQGTSLQGFTSQSPSPSMSPSAYPETSKGPTSTSPPNLVASRNYKNYYDYYRRRYPTYTYAGPNTKPISHYEVVQKIPEAKAEPKKIDDQQLVSTTTTTVNSTTNMQVELLLPLGKMSSGRKMQNQNGTNSNGKLVANSQPKTQIVVGHPKTSTEVKTTVNHNGTIETHFDCESGDESNKNNRVQIKVTDPGNADVILVNQKTGVEKRLSDGPKMNGCGPHGCLTTNGKIRAVQA